MLSNLPQLSFLPVGLLLIHEWHDEQRTPALIERMRASGIFRNPPIVAPLLDGTHRYMVLDGANRVTALKMMGYPHALVQIVRTGDPGLNLQNWNHVVWGMEAEDFLGGIGAVPEISLVPSQGEDEHPDLWGDCDLALIQLPGHKKYSLCTSVDELVKRVQLLNAIVDSYKDHANLDRTGESSIARLVSIYPELSGLVIFPHFEVGHVMSLAGAGYLLPAGITRFTVSPRALHVNYPLEELAADKPLAEKNAALQRWIQDRIAHKGVRFYAEATVLFDE